jgi:AcrR family transcriptional regulator
MAEATKTSEKELTKSDKKEAVYWKVLNSAMELDFRKGHLKWTMSDLSRKSGVTRSLIYYYFGRSKMDILDQAVQLIGEELIGIKKERMQYWRDGQWGRSLEDSRQVCLQAPFLAPFYMIHRDRPTEIGESIRRLEKGFLRKLETLFPERTVYEHRAIFSMLFGIVFAPQSSPEGIEIVIGILKNYLGKK